MRDQDDGDIAKLLHAPNGFQDFHLLLLAKSRSRLIKNEHLGAKINCARNGKCLTLTTRHGTNRLFRVGNGNTDLSHFLSGDAMHLLHFHQSKRTAEMRKFASQKEITGYGTKGIEGKILIHRADTSLGCIAW